MKKLLCLLAMVVLCLCVAKFSLTVFASAPKIHEKHIAKGLIGREVQGWAFQETAACRIKILDAKYDYDKDTAIVYVFVTTLKTDGRSGRKGKLRLEYEYAADDWNLLNIKPISFSRIEGDILDNFIFQLKDIVGYPLLAAAHEGDIDIVKALVAEGVDVDEKAKNGLTALTVAAQRGHLDIAKTLLDKGADVNGKHSRGLTPLIASAAYGHTRLVRLLLDNRADVNARIPHVTALTSPLYLMHMYRTSPYQSLISAEDLVSTVSVLLDHGADMDVPIEHGWTALTLAISFNNLDLVKALLDHGANVNVNFGGVTPLMQAKQRSFTDIIYLVEKAGAKE